MRRLVEVESALKVEKASRSGARCLKSRDKDSRSRPGESAEAAVCEVNATVKSSEGVIVTGGWSGYWSQLWLRGGRRRCATGQTVVSILSERCGASQGREQWTVWWEIAMGGVAGMTCCEAGALIQDGRSAQHQDDAAPQQ